MKKIPKTSWIPTDGLSLEPNALETARSDYNALVFAGPGAGKTELLAQRAAYLLQTGTCAYPARILAISFKKDAASNLKERVTMRLGAELSRRFDSMTFDAFSVGLLMRFSNGLPERYRIIGHPQVVLQDNPMLDEIKYLAPDFYNRYTKEQLLPFFYDKLPHDTGNKPREIRQQVWEAMLSRESPRLPLKMIMRLANLMIDSNPIVKQYLRMTYQYVFLDEFQDTTFIQYDFLSACFFGSESIMTAVGDNKQRIMIWAGAKPDAFDTFVADTGARKLPLFMNFRSAPRLVALQNFFVAQLLHIADVAQPAPHWRPEDGDCRLWEYPDQQTEAEHLLLNVKHWIQEEGLIPRDICILAKQTPDVGARDIMAYFNANGLKVRNETDLQNLITEDLVLFIVAMLYAAADRRYLKQRLEVTEYMKIFTGMSDDHELLVLDGKIAKFLQSLAGTLTKTGHTLEAIGELIKNIIEFAGESKIKSVFTEYKDDAYFKYVLASFGKLLHAELAHSASFAAALDSCLGKDAIPVMTVHKSKGLEYQVIIFVGLEDSAFWTYSKQREEDKCTFFVALSRAKRRIVFTFSHQRDDKYNRTWNQSTANIQDLWDGLINSGIVVHEAIDDAFYL